MFHTIFSFALAVLSADSQKICYAMIQESKQENVCALYLVYSRMYAKVDDSIYSKPFTFKSETNLLKFDRNF